MIKKWFTLSALLVSMGLMPVGPIVLATEMVMHQQEGETTKDLLADFITYEAAVEMFKEKYPKAYLKEVELELDDGRYEYLVKGFDQDHKYELEIDAQIGKITDEDVDDKHYSTKKWDQQLSKAIPDDVITLEAATELAQEQVEHMHAYEWELEADDGRMVWKVKTKNNTQKIKVKIDAQTEEILSVQ